MLSISFTQDLKKNNKLENSVLSWISKGEKKGENIIELHSEIKNDEKKRLKEWWDLSKKIKTKYDHYLDQMKSKESEIEVLIISEAPKLTFDSDKNFKCNYILDDGPVGSYRTVPYESICKHTKTPVEDNYENTAKPLINLFSKKNIGFIDLIPLPLPQITTNLRKSWSFDENYRNGKDPFIIRMLENSIKYFKKKTGRSFSNDLIIILMMPPTTAASIINYCIDLDKTSHEFLYKYSLKIVRTNDNSILKGNNGDNLRKLALRMHRQVVMSGAGGPQKDLFINALK